MSDEIRLRVRFYQSDSGREPVRDWLKALPQQERKAIGDDIKTVQVGWPLGMPLIRKLDSNLWEVRTSVSNRIARIVFTVSGDRMILLHGFIKKSQKMPLNELRLAQRRLGELMS